MAVTIAALWIAQAPSVCAGQDKGSDPTAKVLSVCEALRDVGKLNRKMVAVRGWF